MNYRRSPSSGLKDWQPGQAKVLHMAIQLLLVAAVLTAEPAQPQPAFHQYEREISSLLKQYSQAKNTDAKAAATRALCDVHQRIVSDPRYATSDVLKDYRSRVWSRLTKIKAEIQRHAGRDQAQEAATLAATSPKEAAAATSLAESLSLLDQTQGGPSQWIARGGGPFGPDWGPDLVDLIERTINPAFWDVAGGPGTIVYYRPLQCLVVRATSEVHGQVGGLVGDLRGAGK